MRMMLAVVLTGAGLVLGVVSAAAHHAFAAEFDAKKPISLRGTVARMEWINPHTWIHLDVKKADGKMERWMIKRKMGALRDCYGDRFQVERLSRRGEKPGKP